MEGDAGTRPGDFFLLALVSRVHPCRPIGICLPTYIPLLYAGKYLSISRKGLVMQGVGGGYRGASETQHYVKARKRPGSTSSRGVEDGSHDDNATTDDDNGDGATLMTVMMTYCHR